jgi:endonuclease-3
MGIPGRSAGTSRSRHSPASIAAPTARADKRKFDIGLALSRIREAVRGVPKAAMFALAEEGYATVFEQLVSCILSIRTLDQVSLLAARRLLGEAREPAALARLPVSRIDRLIGEVSFHGAKAEQIRAIARRTAQEYGGTLPCDVDVLRSFKGVGPKCAHLALGVACGELRISVDVHVHRVTNRWGYVRTRTPEETMAGLEKRLPSQYWIEINALLVPFGKHICTGRLPKCSTCPVLDMCRQVGIGAHR